MLSRIGLAIGLTAMFAGSVLAGKADVVDVKVRKTANGTFAFDVTVRHDDTGWKHYADQWQVIAPDGKVLGTRTLFHPHENEQPFTRSLQGVRIAPEIQSVTVRARDSRHGDGGGTQTVAVPH